MSEFNAEYMRRISAENITTDHSQTLNAVKCLIASHARRGAIAVSISTRAKAFNKFGALTATKEHLTSLGFRIEKTSKYYIRISWGDQ